MNIYLLTREAKQYDEVRGFVVCASSKRKARLLCAERCGDEGADEWHHGASRKLIGTSTEDPKTSEGIILCDYKAG